MNSNYYVSQRSSSSYYGIQLLDDLHTYFPALLYDINRFNTVNSVLTYIRTQTQNHFDIFSRASNVYINQQPPPLHTVQVPIAQRTHETQGTVGTQQLNTSSLSPLITQILREAQSTLGNTNNVRVRVTNASTIPLQPLANPGLANYGEVLASLLNLGTEITIDESFMEPVTVAPSQEQVEAATILRGANTADESSTCSICQDAFASGHAIRRIRHCNHEFHRGCIDTWFQSNTHCPMCRWDIREAVAGER